MAVAIEVARGHDNRRLWSRMGNKGSKCAVTLIDKDIEVVEHGDHREIGLAIAAEIAHGDGRCFHVRIVGGGRGEGAVSLIQVDARAAVPGKRGTHGSPIDYHHICIAIAVEIGHSDGLARTRICCLRRKPHPLACAPIRWREVSSICAWRSIDFARMPAAA